MNKAHLGIVAIKQNQLDKPLQPTFIILPLGMSPPKEMQTF